MKKQLAALFLALTLVFTSVVPTFAATASSCKSNQPMYFAMGDSLSAGCKSGSTQNAYDSYRKMDSDESKFSLYTSPVDGEKHNHWYINAVPYTFVSKFARSIGANEETSMNGSHPGLRAKDYCYLLGIVDKSAYKGDNYFGEDATGFQLPAQKNSSDGYKYGIANADVITIELGENDFSTYYSNNSEKLMEIIGGLMSKSNSEEESEALQAMENDLNEVDKAKTEEQVNKGSLKFLANLSQLKETSKPYIEIVEFLVESIGKQAIDTRTYWNKLMNYINKNKKDGAIVIATGMANPLNGLEEYADYLTYYLFNGKETSIDAETLVNLLIKIVDPFIKDVSNYYRMKADNYDYTYVDMPDIKMISTVTGEYDPYDDIYLDSEVTYLIHPNHKESDKILAAIQKAYKKEMLKKGKIVKFIDTDTAADKCKHANSEIQNAVEATYLENGYTGDKVCTDCGRYFYKGTKIDKLVLAGAKIKKLSKGDDRFTVKWSADNKAAGYQVQYSTNSKFKNNKKLTVDSKTTVSKLVKNLKSGKKYYVRVRSFLTVQDKDGKDIKVFSAWSAKKSVTTK